MSEGTNQTVTINGGHLTITNVILFVLAVLMLGYTGSQYLMIADKVVQQTEIIRDVRDQQSADSKKMREQEDLFRAQSTSVDRRLRELENAN